MEEYKKFLFIMNRNEKYAETYLIRKSSKKAIIEALKDGMIYESGKTDIGESQYSLTDKGVNNR